MKKKKGICKDCGPGSKEQYLTAYRCHPHYWAYRRKVNSEKPKNKEKAVLDLMGKKNRDIFFASQLLIAPNHCENCGCSLSFSKSINPRSIIAHIVPKRDKDKGGIPSVALHPLNRWFGCIDCHTNYDSKGADFVKTMKVFPIVKERFAQFAHLIHESEIKNIPAYLCQ